MRLRGQNVALQLLAVVALCLLGACSHVVLLKTDPPGARVIIDGEPRGVSPIFFEEATGSGHTYDVWIDLEGYRSERLQLHQDVWWQSCIWPSLCLMPFTCGTSAFGLLFARSLRDEYTFMLRPLPKAKQQAPERSPASTQPTSAASQPGLDSPPTGLLTPAQIGVGDADDQPASAPAGNSQEPQVPVENPRQQMPPVSASQR